ncbi:hypothetical protein HK101_001569 [Irineochytrium annulatum]|nr:hypothetical protein HK101_001569 [Irineochytrium annulatum]
MREKEVASRPVNWGETNAPALREISDVVKRVETKALAPREELAMLVEELEQKALAPAEVTRTKESVASVPMSISKPVRMIETRAEIVRDKEIEMSRPVASSKTKVPENQTRKTEKDGVNPFYLADMKAAPPTDVVKKTKTKKQAPATAVKKAKSREAPAPAVQAGEPEEDGGKPARRAGPKEMLASAGSTTKAATLAEPSPVPAKDFSTGKGVQEIFDVKDLASPVVLMREVIMAESADIKEKQVQGSKPVYLQHFAFL